MSTSLRHLILVLGDQLNLDASALTDFDPQQDAVWMAEVDEESKHVPSSKQRTSFFLSAMRHFADELRHQKWQLFYSRLDAADNTGSLADELGRIIQQTHPVKLIMTAPGDWRVLQSLRAMAQRHDVPLEIRDDTHFFSTVRQFAKHAECR